jgi:hypothetical protein
MKVGDLVKAINPKSLHNTFKHRDKLIEIVDINGKGFIKLIRLKFHDRITMVGDTLHSWEYSGDWEVDIQRMRNEKLKELGL